MSRDRLVHVIDAPPSVCWAHVFLDPDFTARRLTACGARSFDVLEDRTTPNGERHRRIRVRSRPDAPGMTLFNKLLGDSADYVETSVYDPTSSSMSVVTAFPAFEQRMAFRFVSELLARPDGRSDCVTTRQFDVALPLPLRQLVSAAGRHLCVVYTDRIAIEANRFLSERGLDAPGARCA